jgi:CPA2 family monovalent cation:H+ antiporter-2
MASTVVLIKAMEARGEINGPFGKLAMGWLVVEDFVAIVILVLLPVLSPQPGAQSAGGGILRALGLTATFVALMLLGGRKLFPAVLWRVARTGSRELFTLCVVVIAVGIAYGAGRVFGVSYALGAFLSGMVLRESDYSHRAAERVLPLQDAFSVLFFVSVGMIFDPRIFWRHPLQVLEISSVVVLGKFLWGGATLLFRGQPATVALAMGAGIAQVGEFSFILAGLGTQLGILPETAMNLVLAAAIVSISLHSSVRFGVAPLSAWLQRLRPAWAQGGSDDPLSTLPASTPLQFLTGQVVLVGYEALGTKIAEALLVRAVPFVVVDESSARVEELRERGLPAVRGDAADPAVLIQAHIARAGMLVATTSDAVRDASMIHTARTLNPSVELVFHVDSTEDAERLRREGCTTFLSEDSLAPAMSDHVAARFGKDVPAAT